MGLKFVVSEAQTRSTQASQASSQAQQAVVALQQSIQTFLSAPLSSKAYDSAKNYFMVAYTPICQSIIMTGEALANAHKKFLSEYLATVNGSDLDEDQLVAEIDNYKVLLNTIDDLIRDAKTQRTDLERRSVNVYQAMQKRQEKLEKFRDYSGQSASFFSEYEASQKELNNGIAQVKDCKAWNASTGTFDITRLDMSWAKDISERWESRAKQMEKGHADKFKKAMESRQYVRVQLTSGAYEWMWVKDPSKVTQEDFKFNETYKDYLYILMNPKKNGILDDYFATMAEELRTGINAKTGNPLTDLEKAQRWAAVASAVTTVIIAAKYSKDGIDAKSATPKNPVLKGNKNGKNYTLDRNKRTGNALYKKVPKIPTKNLDSVPQNVLEAFNKYKDNDWRGTVAGQAEGTKAGKAYKNRDRKLPTVDNNGNAINYKEYDVNDKIPGMDRGSERLIRGSDGKIYYTDDHYKTFVKLKE
ncbi:ribonuclease domain-containing protein [Enterococcus sp. 5H]|uniref:ribonuclease domain-containing protein n=1 Tax=Enterococcus sp. 5H TaxID=1229490 RepID=UPI0023034BCB|nr:ribonuclease domain-containing protein [Enterococcus sp. 5H]MDA9471879.1 hypothetical protein [Enterococcus sp. 5H]